MRVLVACEMSGVVRDAFRARGHCAWSCDILPTEGDPEYHFQCDVTEILYGGWDLMIAHPPCTYLCNSGVRHLHESVKSKNGKVAAVSGESRMVAMRIASRFFNQLQNAPIPHICVENPILHRYARELIGNYTQIIQPWQHGHMETKATCLWLKNLPPLYPSNNVRADMMALAKNKRNRIHYMPPGKDRAKERSRTFWGIANAMAQQWGDL